MQILVVEDEPKAAAYLRNGLAEHGFVVDVARQGDDGFELVESRTQPPEPVPADVSYDSIPQP